MHGDHEMVVPLLTAAAEAAHAHKASVEVIVCPPFPLLYSVAYILKDSVVNLGAQNCHAEREGAYTGEVSAAMLTEASCTHVILGHSERRAACQETDAEVKKKAKIAMECGLIPIICVGETQAEREAGEAEDVVAAQAKGSLPENAQKDEFLLAYEPVWAIGSGLTPEVSEIEAMHACVQRAVAAPVTVLYGGSVKAENARTILAIPGVGGVLVGGASLNAEAFASIIMSADGQKI
jgi:triosephosphate isomerase (TIM)